MPWYDDPFNGYFVDLTAYTGIYSVYTFSDKKVCKVFLCVADPLHGCYIVRIWDKFLL